MRQTENRFVLLESNPIGDDITSSLPQNMRTALQNGIHNANDTIMQNHPNPPSDPLGDGRRQTLQERMLFNTLAAFAGTLTDTAKEYLLAELQNARPNREILKTMAVEYFKVLVNTLDASLDDVEAQIRAVSADDTRRFFTSMTSNTQNHLSSTIDRVARQFQNSVAHTRLPNIPISATQQAFLSDENNLSEDQRSRLEGLKCPISHEIMTNPVIVKTAANTHHVYDLSSIESYEAINGRLTQNPMDNSPIQPDQQRWAPCQSTRALTQAFLNTLKLTQIAEMPSLDDLTRHIASKIVIPEKIITDLGESAPSELLDPFTGKIMDQPVTLDGFTMNLSTLLGNEDIKPLTTITNAQDQTEYQIILNQGDGTERTVTFQSIFECIEAATSNRLLRTQIIMWITKKCKQLNISYDPNENRDSANDTSSQTENAQSADSSNSGLFNLFNRLSTSQPDTSTFGSSIFEQMTRDNLNGTNQLATDQRNGESGLDTLRRRGNGSQPLFESANPNYDGPHGGPTIIYDENGPVNRGSDQTNNSL
jgi:hypothetical protein